jgi:hypothetical protein
MRNTAFVLTIAAAALALPRLGGAAASFTVDPMQLNLSRRTTSQLLTISNESKNDIRFEIKAFKWDHDESGETTLEPTKDIVQFRGSGSSSAPAFERTLVGWYLLPGRSWVFTAPVSANECQSASSVAVRAVVNGQTLNATGAVPAGACSGAP